jgi:ferritin
MPKITIKSATLVALKAQYNEELANAHAYEALAIWCRRQNLDGFGRYFHIQAGEEREHAEKIAGHLLDRGEVPVTGSLSAPKADFKNILEVAQFAQTMEGTTTSKINAVYETALKDGDYPAQLLLHWFINEQVEEEAWADEMVARITGATCAGSLVSLDRHIVGILGKGGE